jgi:hypothetical protein
VLRSRDLDCIFQREGVGRPAITALAFVDGGKLAIGDYRGDVELLDWRNGVSEARSLAGNGEVLALAAGDGGLVAIRRSGEPLGWGRLTGASATPEGCVGWSTLSRRIALQGREPIEGVPVVAAALAGARLVSIEGRAPGPAALVCRDRASGAESWRVELGHRANALAADEGAGCVLAADPAGVDVRAAADGRLLERIDVVEAQPHSLRDGRRMLLVQDAHLAVLDLPASGRAAHVEPAFDAHRGGVTAVAFSADGSLLATGGARGDLLVFRVLPVPQSGVAP